MRRAGGSLLGLVTGLRVGRNLLIATARGQLATLTVTDHAITGPVFSGKQQLPFFCQTTSFGLAAATTNPHGVICNSSEQIVNQVGADPKTGFPNSVLDNTGVQYGLAALKSGAITPAQFASLNAAIGGLDFTGAPSATRSAASLRALNAVYADDLYNGAGPADDPGHRRPRRPRRGRARERHPHHGLVIHHAGPAPAVQRV